MAQILTYQNVFISMGLVGLCLIVSVVLNLNLHNKLFVALIRSLVQLSLLGYILKWLFAKSHVGPFVVAYFIMVFIASRASAKRVTIPFKGLYWSTFGSIFLSSFITGLYTLHFAIPQDPWFNIPTAIPLIGMILGNSLTGVSLALNYFIHQITENRPKIEDRLFLGATPFESVKEILIQSLQTGLTPILNSMMVVGLVSIPGMMTGQILAGNSANQAALYQMSILFIILASSFFSCLAIVLVTFYRYFDENSAPSEKFFEGVSS